MWKTIESRQLSESWKSDQLPVTLGNGVGGPVQSDLFWFSHPGRSPSRTVSSGVQWISKWPWTKHKSVAAMTNGMCLLLDTLKTFDLIRRCTWPNERRGLGPMLFYCHSIVPLAHFDGSTSIICISPGKFKCAFYISISGCAAIKDFFEFPKAFSQFVSWIQPPQRLLEVNVKTTKKTKKKKKTCAVCVWHLMSMWHLSRKPFGPKSQF